MSSLSSPRQLIATHPPTHRTPPGKRLQVNNEQTIIVSLGSGKYLHQTGLPSKPMPLFALPTLPLASISTAVNSPQLATHTPCTSYNLTYARFTIRHPQLALPSHLSLFTRHKKGTQLHHSRRSIPANETPRRRLAHSESPGPLQHP